MSEPTTTPDPWAWRFETPGTAGWAGSPRPEAPNKYFMVSADGHANEPANLWHERMDDAFAYMWVRPKLKNLPSDSFRASGFASFQEDAAGLALAREHDLVGNFMWANDYPHHEGTWPHSAEAIERTMGMLEEGERRQILGGNAARVFGFPERRLVRSELS
jgi:predicted TIM-barrel fold metal-dependent hydrolase